MNLVDLWKRKDRALLEPPAGVEPCLHRIADHAMHALRLPTGSSLRIGELLAFDEMRVPPRWNGWAVAVEAPVRAPVVLQLAVDFGPGLRTEEVATCRLDETSAGRWVPLRCNWPLLAGTFTDAHLVLTVTGAPGSSVVLGVSDAVDLRRPIMALAKGRGIEIGPGMNPQIHPAADVEVRYLEQYPVEDWARIYPKQELDQVPARVRALWKDYITGNAQQLEIVADGSLDFVFSSHVFEHLVNPLGTLAVWKRKSAYQRGPSSA